MQRVIRTIPNRLKVCDEIDNLYAYTSELEHQKSLIAHTFDSSVQSIIDEFNKRTDAHYEPQYIDRKYEQIKPIHNKNIILCFSGGKDSVASALKYREAGYNVHLYHMRHINTGLSDEWKFAEKCAGQLGLPLHQETIKLSGHNVWMEHPMKNMIIACGALEFGLRNNLTTDIAFGNYTSSMLDDNAFDRCAGDCVDFWDEFIPVIRKSIPDFKIHINLDSMNETLEIMTPKTELLENSVSCLCRHSLRDYRHQWVKEKFGVDLPKNRCGSCYKCCVEYIYMADHDLIKFDSEYYRYCFNQLYKVATSEEVILFTPIGLWELYFFYPLEESKMCDEIKKGRLFGKNIKWEGRKIIQK